MHVSLFSYRHTILSRHKSIGWDFIFANVVSIFFFFWSLHPAANTISSVNNKMLLFMKIFIDFVLWISFGVNLLISSGLLAWEDSNYKHCCMINYRLILRDSAVNHTKCGEFISYTCVSGSLKYLTSLSSQLDYDNCNWCHLTYCICCSWYECINHLSPTLSFRILSFDW